MIRPFRDPLPADFPRAGVNPYVASHRAFGDEILPASEAPRWRGRWSEHFGREAPLHLEIGSGNGFYLSGMAALHPECDWIGVELRYKRVVLAAQKLRKHELRNARVVRYDALRLEELLTPASLAGLHVNHPDPWSREKQKKHRIIDRAFCEMAVRLVRPGGEIRLKTDFLPHVHALVQNAEGLPLRVTAVRHDIATNGAPWDDEVVTNYQRKAREAGVPVHACWMARE